MCIDNKTNLHCTACRNVPAVAAMRSAAAFSSSRFSSQMFAAAASARLGDSLHSVDTPSLIVDLDGGSPFGSPTLLFITVKRASQHVVRC
jgi:hypothetical protein